MIKIIKYSITFIIFSIIASLFVLYFYLLKGIEIKNLNYEHINIGKLYIKIDKKLILNLENIYIKYKDSQKPSKKKLNFIQIKKDIAKYVNYLDFFQSIKISNFKFNDFQINFFTLNKNTITFNNPDIAFKTSFFINKKNIILKTEYVDVIKYNIYLKNIYTSINFSKSRLKIDISMFYRNSKNNFHVIIKNNNHIFYNGVILNLSKNTLNNFKKQLQLIDNFNIAQIYFNGNLDTINFKIIDINLKKDKTNINTKFIRGNFNISENKLLLKNKFITLKINNNIVNLFNTKIYYYLNNNKAYINNKKIELFSPKANVTLSNNTISYFKDKAIIKSKFLKIKHNLASIYINNIKAQYIKNKMYAYIPNTNVENNDTKIVLNDIVLVYNKALFADIPFIKIKSPFIFAKLNNTSLKYDKNKINSNIQKIFLKSYGIVGNIYNNKIDYNLETNLLSIANKKALLKYLKIKDIALYNIKTTFHNNKLITNIPKSEVEKIKLYNIVLKLQNNILNVFFNTNTLLSKKLNSILANFKINIPIYQKYGKNKIKGKLSYNLKNSKIDTYLKIKVKNSKLMLTKTTYLKIYKSDLELNNSIISLKNTLLDYNQSIVNTNYYINKGIINLDKSYIQTYGKLNDLNITGIVEIKNYPENLYIDLNGIDIFLQKLKVGILIHKDIIVNIDKLSKFYPYINYLQEYNINDGKVKVNIGDNIKIDSNITDTNQTILAKNLKPLKNINITTIIDNNKYKIFNPNIKMTIIQKENNLSINGGYKNLDINITKFVDTNKSDNNSSQNIIANIKAINSYISYNDLKLFSKKLSIDYNTTNAHIESIYKDRNITILYNDGRIKIYGLNIKDKTFKELTNTNILNKPLITFFAIKNKNSDILQGFLDIKKGYIKELKAFNNILAFINLIPSLITFQPAGFSSKGYKIKSGHIEYLLYENILYLKTINIKGENMTFNGNGFLDLKTKTMEINIDVNLLVKLIKDIPIVNYILLGKDGGITISIRVEGPFNNPQVHKNTISNILSTPFDIIKRVILTPFRPFMKKEEQ